VRLSVDGRGEGREGGEVSMTMRAATDDGFVLGFVSLLWLFKHAAGA